MDWIRRNWPDLLIGLALLAVIAGIIATLLNGGSFFPSGGSSPSASPSAATATMQPGTQPGTQQDAQPTTQPNSTAANETADDAAVDPASQDDTSGVEIGVSDISEDAAADTDTDAPDTDIPVISSSGDTTSETSPADTTESSAPADISSESAATTPTSESVVGIEVDPISPTPVETASDNSGVESAYRILVGSFGNADNALRRTQALEEAGFPAFTAAQDNLTLALVGPFDTRSEAESALNQIQNEGLEASPVLFEPATSDAATVDATPSDTTINNTTTSDGETAASDQADTGTSASSSASGEMYLQTGAYGSSESARPQRERLEGLGFNVSEVTEGSFVKLLVGPFGDDELPTAQSRLSAQGIDHFVRSN